MRSRCSEAGKKQTQDLQRTHRKLLERVKCCCSLQLLHIYIYIYTVHVYTVRVILSASDESASLCALFFVPPRSHRKVRPEGSPRGGGGAVCRRKILSSVHRPPFGTKTVEKALYTYTFGLVFVVVGLKKKCVHLFCPLLLKGSRYDRFHRLTKKYRHTHTIPKRQKKRVQERKRASSSRRRHLCFVTIKKISRHPSSKVPKSTQEHARNDDDDVTMIYTRMEPLCCGRK